MFNNNAAVQSVISNAKELPLGLIALTAINPYMGAAWLTFQVGKAVADQFKAPECSDGFYALFTHVCVMYGYEPMTRANLLRAHAALTKEDYVIKCSTEEEFVKWLSDLQDADEKIRQNVPARELLSRFATVAA